MALSYGILQKKKVPRCLVKTVMDPNDPKLRKYMSKEFNTQWN